MPSRPFTINRSPRRHAHTQKSAGFTLLEVILAVTIAGALLAAAATLMVSITDAWLQRQDRHFFEDHVDGVAEFLQASFTLAGSEITVETDESSSGEDDSGNENDSNDESENPQVSIGMPREDDRDRSGTDRPDSNQGDSGSALLSVPEDPISWQSPPGFADFEDPLLSFRLQERPALLVQTDNAPVAGVEAYLHFEEDEGLSLLWFTPLQEQSEDLNDLRRTPLSDLVTKVEYIYWDERFERWETEEEPLDGEGNDEFVLPRFLKLTFEYEGVRKERTLTLPVPSLKALVF